MARGASAARAERAGEAARADGVCARASGRTTGWRASTRRANDDPSHRRRAFGVLPLPRGWRSRPRVSAQPLRSRRLLLLKTNNGDGNHRWRALFNCSASMDVSWWARQRPRTWVSACGVRAVRRALYLWPARPRASRPPRGDPATHRQPARDVRRVVRPALVALQVAPPCAAARRGRRARDRRRGDGPRRRRGPRRDRQPVSVRAALPRAARARAGRRRRERRASFSKRSRRSRRRRGATVVALTEVGVPCGACPRWCCRRATVAQAVTLAPLLFGSAHVHHLETRERMIAAEKRTFCLALGTRRRRAARRRARALLAVSAQFAYTSLFGAFASFRCCEQATRARRRWRTRSAVTGVPGVSPRRGAGTEPSSSRRARGHHRVRRALAHGPDEAPRVALG